MVIDNFDTLNKNILKFNKGEFYKFIALYRNKDGNQILKSKDHKEILVRSWLVDNKEYFDKVVNDMKVICELLNCRLYVTLDSKSMVKSVVQASNYLNTLLSSFALNNIQDMSPRALNKTINSVTSLSECTGTERRWMFDVDTKDEKTLKDVIDFIPDESKICVLNTVNGYHVVAKRNFNATTFKHDNVELKTNAIGLAYFNPKTI